MGNAKSLECGVHSTEALTIVIPTLNEEGNIGRTLDIARSNYTGNKAPELIVVDGGSQDRTVAEARAHGARTLRSNGGRAYQFNKGAKVAQGEVLLFLHADSELPARYDFHISSALQKPKSIAGAFQLKIMSDLPGLRIVERFANLRARFLQLPYGDQGLFLRKEVFEGVGAYPELSFMEDYEMSRRLARRGRIVIANVAIKTSARRWETLGVFKTTLLNQIIVVGYHLGVPINRLKYWYRKHHSPSIPYELSRTR